MKAHVLDRYGKQQPLRLAEMPDPVPGDDDVLIEVHAAGLNPLDSKIRDGEFKPLLPYKPPFILGHDLAGRVVQVGKSVSRFAVGDEVYARPRDGRIGTLAELIAVCADDVAHKPANLSMVEAASLPLVALTAWQALVEEGRLQAGQNVLIHAGSGGVGVVAIQLARHIGASVATTAGSAGADLVRTLGADRVVNYREEDFAAILPPQDLIVASQDAATLARSAVLLTPGGMLTSLSGPPDPAFARAKGLNVLMRLLFTGMSWSIRRKAKARGAVYNFMFMHPSGEQLAEITRLVEVGVLKPVVDRTFAFAAVNEAMAYVDEGRVKGKVVIDFGRVA